MGFDAGNETMDIILNADVENPKEALNNVLPEGIRIQKADIIQGKRPSIMEHTSELLYVFNLKEEINIDSVRKRLGEQLSEEKVLCERKHKKGSKIINLKPFIKSWDITEKTLSVCYKVIESQTGRPDEFLKLAFGENIPYFIGERKHATVKD